MSSTPTEPQECANQMDDLRHVQLLLKREDIFTDFQEKEIQDLNKSLRSEWGDVLRHQKFLLFLHVNSMGDKAINLKPEFFDSLFEGKNPSEKERTATAAANQITIYNKVITAFGENVSDLAAAAADLAKKKPELIDQMSFSTVPGLFGYLWSAESAEKFLVFLKELIAKAPEQAKDFARVIFAVPPFRQFFDAVMGELVNRVALVKTKEDADAFTNDFIEKWNENAPFCPNIVKQTLEMASDQADLLIGAFLAPAFASPRTFGIIPLSLRIGPEQPDMILESLKGRASEMCEVLAKVENPTTLPSSEKLSKILPELGKNALFTAEDLAVLSELVESINQINPEFPVKASQLEGGTTTSTKYQPVSFTLPTVQEVHKASGTGEAGSKEDELERQLREMLTGVDVIPLAAQSSGTPDMVELLKSQVQLARPDHRLLLEMKIDDFERARADLPTPYDFKAFLDLLKRKFEERQPQRLDKLSKISLYNTEFSQMGQLSKSLTAAIEVYRDVLKFHLVERWVKQTNPLSEISDDLCRNRAQFHTFFFDIIAKWKEWCTEQGYKDQGCEAILHNIVMTELPQERFLRVNPQLVEKDEACYKGLIEKHDYFLKENTFDFTSAFQQNPKLLEAAQRQLQKAWDAALPLIKLDGFCVALNTLVFVLTFEGHKEIGADQWLPMTILLFLLSKPKQLPSTIAYINHFVKSLSDESSGTVTGEKLISEQTEYNFTMIKSALCHFGNTIEGISIPDEQ